ncbi:MAG: TetR/AcrR family transcriptional regulator [Comamonadaceae bacterium]|nr:MAG: TetR/AcrR family transcriptional regulator [Comamonadaceae bacterium]
MAPRAYNNETRQQQQEELKQRVAEAAARLHADRGVLATSYAEIAQAAGISLPTMYKHFPDLGQLVRACSGHVASQAPAFPADEILAAPDLAAAARLLVEAMDLRHAHFEPWMAWREASRIPVIAETAAARRREIVQLCEALLARHGASGPLREQAAVWESLLDFELWHRLVRAHRLPRAAVRTHLHSLVLAVTGPQPAPPSQRPNRRSSP